MPDIAVPAIPSTPASPAAKVSTPAPVAKAPPVVEAKRPPTAADFRNRAFELPDGDDDIETPTDVSPPADSPDLPDGDDEYTEPEDVLETDEPEEDLAWLQELKDFKEIHGLPVKEILAALMEGKLPDALLAKIKVKLKDGDNEWEDSIESARNGAMLRSNYTKKTMAFSQERDTFHAEKDQFVDMVRNWTTPEGLKHGLTTLGLPFLEAAKLLAQEEQELDEMEAASPGTKEIMKARQKAKLELEQAQKELARLEQGRQKQSTEATEKQIVEGVRNIAPAVFESIGLKLNNGTWDIFNYHLRALWAEHGFDKTNKAMVEFAAKAAKEEVDAYVKNAQGGAEPTPPPPVKKGPTLGGKTYDGPPPKVKTAARPGQVRGSSDFRKRVLSSF